MTVAKTERVTIFRYVMALVCPGVRMTYFIHTLRARAEAIGDRYVEREFMEMFLHSFKEQKMKYSFSKHFIEINC